VKNSYVSRLCKLREESKSRRKEKSKFVGKILGKNSCVLQFCESLIFLYLLWKREHSQAAGTTASSTHSGLQSGTQPRSVGRLI